MGVLRAKATFCPWGSCAGALASWHHGCVLGKTPTRRWLWLLFVCFYIFLFKQKRRGSSQSEAGRRGSGVGSFQDPGVLLTYVTASGITCTAGRPLRRSPHRAPVSPGLCVQTWALVAVQAWRFIFLVSCLSWTSGVTRGLAQSESWPGVSFAYRCHIFKHTSAHMQGHKGRPCRCGLMGLDTHLKPCVTLLTDYLNSDSAFAVRFASN